MIVDAAYSELLDGGKVRCHLCPAECLLTEGKIGICGSRFNSNGKLMTDNFGELVSACYDPVEKKPLYHFHPGKAIFSTGPNGCNLNCSNCQNWEISQGHVPTRFVAPPDLVNLAGRNGSIGIAYTYTEPLIWFEYIREAGKLIKDAGLKNVLVTNGYINEKPLMELLPLIDAANVDLKSMSPDFYKRICKGKLQPVLDNIKHFHEAGVKIEITNLVITGLNDSDHDFEAISDFVASVSTHIPLHFSAYYPTYKMNNPPTSVQKLMRAYEISSKKLDFVYLGNVRIPDRSDTFCPQCKERLICRSGYHIEILELENGKCKNCSHDLNIIQ
ncbi:MAG: AmmeMemoRadiSam system radical SAM enzyme [candidate division Zixibacteria bacterium HGW-Zixibacteria-1]|nr:MAG: AmmeMemoRadiSam system radical SAM enzyme [candidate division Zixibacteria bacterium HGW-Zixibacteria-1]